MKKKKKKPTILKIITKEECKIKWKVILNEFKKENPELNVNYGNWELAQTPLSNPLFFINLALYISNNK